MNAPLDPCEASSLLLQPKSMPSVSMKPTRRKGRRQIDRLRLGALRWIEVRDRNPDDLDT